MSDLDIRTEAAGPVTVIAPVGRIDSATAKSFETETLGTIDRGSTKLVLDFGGLDYISSAGLRVVLLTGKRIKAENGTLVLAALKPAIRDVFEISGFLNLFDVEENREAAITAAT